MFERRITKVKLTKENFLDVCYKESVGSDEPKDDQVDRKGSHEVHPDLLEKLKSLRIHLATMCDEGEYTDFEDNPEKLDIFSVTGYTFGGEDNTHGVTLIGQKLLKNNKVLNLIPPFVKLNPSESDYSFVTSLAESLVEADVEADAYVAGKFAPMRQLSLFDQAPSEDEEADGEEETERPAKRQRQRKLKEESEAA